MLQFIHKIPVYSILEEEKPPSLAYAIGVAIQENNKLVSPKLSLLKVQSGQVNHRNTLLVTLQNLKSIIWRDLKLQGKIYRKGRMEVNKYNE
ncbi:WxL protein host-binding domain-containing protein [Listeria sp. ILCC792]|uniref:WxL protein host-binding domain-containing protein n=1 Tax=Listeria sp. ILCC792 TaxID=1918331 RepID=UPI001356591B|nr:DUF3324 domain-containing protein [Listeria sp. ILCC792]